MNFGALEFRLLTGIAALVALEPEVGRAVAGPLIFRYRLRVFAALVRARVEPDNPLIAKLDAIMEELTKVADLRNKIIHAPWLDVPGTNIDEVKSIFRSTSSIGKGLIETATPTTPAQIETLSNSVFTANANFTKFMSELASCNLIYDHSALRNDGEPHAPDPSNISVLSLQNPQLGGNSSPSTVNFKQP